MFAKKTRKMQMIIKKLWKTLNYKISLSSYRLKQFFHRIHATKIGPEYFKILSFCYFVFLLGISFFVSFYVWNESIFKIVPSFLATAGAMIGGILAIIISFGCLLMQNAANSTSAGFYNLIAKDRVQHVVYWLLTGIILWLFSFSLFFGNNDFAAKRPFLSSLSVMTSFFLIGCSFWLLYYLFKRIHLRINPYANIKVIYQDSFKYITQISKITHEMASVMHKVPDKPSNQTYETTLAGAFQLVKPQIKSLSARIDFLFDYHDKLLANSEKRTAKEVLNIIYSILVSYMSLRSKSSIVIPDSVGFYLVGISDSQSFLSKHLEGLVAKGKQYINQNDDVGATHIIDLLKNLTISSKDIEYVTGQNNENPIFSQCRGYLGQITEYALHKQSLEASFQCTRALTDISLVACKKNLSNQISLIIELLDKICLMSLLANQRVVWQTAYETLIFVLRSIIQNWQYSYSYPLKQLMNKALGIIVYSLKAPLSNGAIENIDIHTKLGEFFSCVLSEIDRTIRALDNGNQNIVRSSLESLVEEYIALLRGLSENKVTADCLLMTSIGNSIAGIGRLLLYVSNKTANVDEDETLIKSVMSLIYIPGWFIYNSEAVSPSMSFDTLIESIAKIGLYATEIQNNKVAMQAISSIFNAADTMFEKESGSRYGFTCPRIVELAGYIAILANKNGQVEVLDKFKEELEPFQVKYEKEVISKWPQGTSSLGPRKDQVCRELFKLRREAYENCARRDIAARLSDRACDYLLQKIDYVDIDRFIYMIWRTWLANSPIVEELNLEKEADIDLTKL